MIFDRAPVDSIAYSVYTANQGATDIDAAFVETLVPAVRESLDYPDILAFVPKTDDWPVEMEADGIRPVDHAYRDEVDAIFKQIYREGRFQVMPEIREAWGQRDHPSLSEFPEVEVSERSVPSLDTGIDIPTTASSCSRSSGRSMLPTETTKFSSGAGSRGFSLQQTMMPALSAAALSSARPSAFGTFPLGTMQIMAEACIREACR